MKHLFVLYNNIYIFIYIIVLEHLIVVFYAHYNKRRLKYTISLTILFYLQLVTHCCSKYQHILILNLNSDKSEVCFFETGQRRQRSGLPSSVLSVAVAGCCTDVCEKLAKLGITSDSRPILIFDDRAS